MTKSLSYYAAAVTDLELAIKLIEEVNSNFPQYRVPLKDTKKSLKALEKAHNKKINMLYGER